MKPSYIGAILIAISGLMPFALFAADSEAGKTKSALCAGCHGVDGNSVNAVWPSLAGQHASYLVKQINNFKSGERTDPTMQGMVAALSETDIQDIAAYYENQKSKPVGFEASMIEQGEAIYRGGITETSVAACMSCHSPSGAGLEPAAYPSLKGQHPDYLAAQLKKFRDGSRANDSGNMMRSVAKRMTDQEIAAVSAYLAGIQ
jgi:cytochrome c553